MARFDERLDGAERMMNRTDGVDVEQSRRNEAALLADPIARAAAERLQTALESGNQREIDKANAKFTGYINKALKRLGIDEG